MSAGGGGAWKVAYADFVTAMMAFFMVMWLTTQKEGVKEAVAGYFRDPFATFKSNEKGAAATAAQITNPMYGHTAQPQKRPIAISGDSTDYQFTVIFPNDDATIESSQLEYIKGFAPMMVGRVWIRPTFGSRSMAAVSRTMASPVIRLSASRMIMAS